MLHPRTPGLPCLLLSGALACACGCAASAPVSKAPVDDKASATTTAAVQDEPKRGSTAPLQVTANPVVECDLVCERAQVVRRTLNEPDYHAQATASANRILDAMHPDLLACYKKRVAINPAAHGFITVAIVVGPDGHIRDVETTGGAILGEGTMGCIVERVKKATFEPPHGGGTMRIEVPFSLRRTHPSDDTY